jgi:hypothetical protein
MHISFIGVDESKKCFNGEFKRLMHKFKRLMQKQICSFFIISKIEMLIYYKKQMFLQNLNS